MRKQLVLLTQLHSNAARDLLKLSIEQIKMNAKTNEPGANKGTRVTSRTIRASVHRMSIAVRTARGRKELRAIGRKIQEEKDKNNQLLIHNPPPKPKQTLSLVRGRLVGL